MSAVRRPEPFDHLSPEEKEVWKLTTCGLPEHWFRPETLVLLERYCSHAVRARVTSAKLKDPKLPRSEYADLEKQEREQTRMVLWLATKMRITQQSTLDRKNSKHSKGSAKAPWDQDDDEED